MTASEIAHVLRAARATLAGTTWTLEPGTGRPGMDVRKGPGGLPRAIRYTLETEGGFVTVDPGSRSRDASTSRVTTVIIDCVGRPGRRCAGGGPVGELVIEYSRAGTADTWTARARRRMRVDVGLPGRLEGGHGSFPRHRGKRVEKLVQAVASFQIVDVGQSARQGMDNSRAATRLR